MSAKRIVVILLRDLDYLNEWTHASYLILRRQNKEAGEEIKEIEIK